MLRLLLLRKVAVEVADAVKFDINSAVTVENCCYFCSYCLTLLLFLLLLSKVPVTIAVTVKLYVIYSVPLKFSMTIAVTV